MYKQCDLVVYTTIIPVTYWYIGVPPPGKQHQKLCFVRALTEYKRESKSLCGSAVLELDKSPRRAGTRKLRVRPTRLEPASTHPASSWKRGVFLYKMRVRGEERNGFLALASFALCLFKSSQSRPGHFRSFYDSHRATGALETVCQVGR